MSERFSLKWNDYQSNWSKTLAELRNDHELSDIILISEDKVKFSAHKILLSSCSKMLKFILNDTKQANLLFLGGVSSINLGFILDYIYHGEVKIFQEHLDSFLECAQKLELLGLLVDNQNQKADPRQSIQEEDNMDIESKNDNIKKSSEFCKEETVEAISSSTGYSSNLFLKEENSLVDLNDCTLGEIERKNSRSSVKRATKYLVEGMNPAEIDAKIKSMYQKINESWVCLECSKAVNNQSNMRKHVDIHLYGLKYSCSSCSKDFRSKNLLYLHTKTKEHQYLKLKKDEENSRIKSVVSV